MGFITRDAAITGAGGSFLTIITIITIIWEDTLTRMQGEC